MGSNFRCYQLKIDCYRYKLLNVSLMVTTKQKYIVNAQNLMRKEAEHSTKESHQTKAVASKRRRKRQRATAEQPENNFKPG